MPSPKKRGSIKLPIINSVAVSKPTIKHKCPPRPNCKNNTGTGSNTAIIEPTLGIKLSRNANSANSRASFTLNASKMMAIIRPVAREVIVFTGQRLSYV